ncbi:sodium:calcium antiporter [Candidatus Micrarchaeota archaeon]|nr:sodium:calcium antiporter [Candidatus Micrarchaeota archaeon]
MVVSMLTALVGIVIGIVILVKSADIIVDKIILLGREFKLNDVILGTLLLSITTSLPELSIMSYSVLSNAGEVSLGDILGSNITNMGLALGIALTIGMANIKNKRIIIRKKEMKDILDYLVISVVIILIILSLPLAQKIIGPILILFFIGYFMFSVQKKNDQQKTHDDEKFTIYSLAVLLISLVLLILSSKLCVDSAVSLSIILGLEKSFIGATIVALGTSLPEITVELNTIKKKKYLLALGDAIGSIIINITLVLGLLTTFSNMIIDIPMLFILSLYTFILIGELYYFVGIKKQLDRYTGIILLATYVIYIIILSSTQVIEILYKTI